MLAGAPTTGYSARDVLDLAYAAWVDGYNGLIDPHEVRQKIDEALETAWADRETWGMDADALDAIPSAPRRAEVQMPD